MLSEIIVDNDVNDIGLALCVSEHNVATGKHLIGL